MIRKHILAITVLVLMSPSGSLATLITAEQEKTFTSDGVIQEGDFYTGVAVYDTPPAHTIVNMTGGTVGEPLDADSGLYAYDSSQVNISGGQVLYLHTTDASTVNITGGTVGNWDLGGLVSVDTYGSSVINLYKGGEITGGTYNFFHMHDSSTLNVYGGGVYVFFTLDNDSTLNLYDGWIFDLSIFGTANVYGGRIQSWDLFTIWGDGQLNVYGRDFQYDPQWKWVENVGGGPRWISHLTGTGFDGVAIDIQDIPDPYTTPNINLIPEPTTFALLALGVLALAKHPAS